MAAKRKKRTRRSQRTNKYPLQPDEPPKAGSDQVYSRALAVELCSRLSQGRSLRSVCKDEGMPAPRTVFYWLATREDFKALYTAAKEESADFLVEDILDIADDGTNDWYDAETKDGGTVRKVDHEHIQRSKLRVDTRKWIASKMKPKKYGESLKLGGDPDNPVPVAVTIVRFGSDGKLSAPFVTPASASPAP